MLKALQVTGRALALWWRHLGQLTLFNVAWLALQVPIVTGPPATAAMFVIARRVADGELLDLRDGLAAFRQLWWPAWRWGLVNLVIGVALLGNFAAYQSAPGWGWAALRALWTIVGVLWLLLNLFYWPFWLAQADQRLATTARNSLVLIIKAPLFSLTLLGLCAVLTIAGVLLTLPLAVALMAWLALIGTLAVDQALRARPTPTPAPATEAPAEAQAA